MQKKSGIEYVEYYNFGDRLGRLRRDRKWTSAKMGRVCCVSRSSIAYYERGRDPSLSGHCQVNWFPRDRDTISSV